MGIGIQEVLL